MPITFLNGKESLENGHVRTIFVHETIQASYEDLRGGGGGGLQLGGLLC